MVFNKILISSDTSWRWSRIPHTHNNTCCRERKQWTLHLQKKKKNPSKLRGVFKNFFMFWGGPSFNNQSSIINIHHSTFENQLGQHGGGSSIFWRSALSVGPFLVVLCYQQQQKSLKKKHDGRKQSKMYRNFSTAVLQHILHQLNSVPKHFNLFIPQGAFNS